jgi:regulator of vacuolar morphogenesis
LDKGLEGVDGLGVGERTRREGMVVTMRDELGNLERMAEAGVRVTTANVGAKSDGNRSSSPANDTARAALLGQPPPPSRVFGSTASTTSPQETAETRPLDDRGLVQLQQQQMDKQDTQLQSLSSILRRQMTLGNEISREIGEQNEMLDEVSTEVDRVGGKLGRAKREMNR